jgi:cytochrome c peroxidase
MKPMIALVLLCAVALACSEPASPPTPAAAPAAPAGPDRAALRARANQILGSLPDEAVSEKNPVSEAKITLGRMLYYDTRFSKA